MPTTQDIQDWSNEILMALAGGTPTNPAGIPQQLAQLVLAQAKHETDGFTSDAFLWGGNAFGYGYVPGAYWQMSYPNPASEGTRQLAAYNSAGDSAREIVDYLYRRVREGTFPALTAISTPAQYATYLKNAGFYGDSVTNYTNGITRWYQSLGPATVAGGGAGILILIALGAIVMTKRKKRSNYAK